MTFLKIQCEGGNLIFSSPVIAKSIISHLNELILYHSWSIHVSVFFSCLSVFSSTGLCVYSQPQRHGILITKSIYYIFGHVPLPWTSASTSAGWVSWRSASHQGMAGRPHVFPRGSHRYSGFLPGLGGRVGTDFCVTHSWEMAVPIVDVDKLWSSTSLFMHVRLASWSPLNSPRRLSFNAKMPSKEELAVLHVLSGAALPGQAGSLAPSIHLVAASRKQ